jgi:pyruvate ferredoxin oxidoreductase beta subunit
MRYTIKAVETGRFALKEAINGVVTHTYLPRRKRLVEEYLHGQGRYRPLFERQRNEEAIRNMQQRVDRYWVDVHDTTGAAR